MADLENNTKYKNVAVVMCTYSRPERLPLTLKQLAAQNGVIIDLYIWNNNPTIADEVDAAIASSKLNIHVHHNPENIGGFARFYQAKEIASKYPFIITIDDDMGVEPNTIKTLVTEFELKTIKSFYAFNLLNPDDYFDRTATGPGEKADYCGTGGAIIDSSLFLHPELFMCPKEYWFIEDLWMCFVANHQLGWTLYKSNAVFTFDKGDFKDQWLKLKDKKSEFLQYLVQMGWKIPSI